MAHMIPVRKGEELNIERLQAYLHQTIEDLPNEPLIIQQFGTGASNLTYSISIGDFEVVLRRPPMGPVAPKAHDMEREYRILKTISEVLPIAPTPYCYCEDETIIGKPFIIMERKHGVLVDTSFPEGITPTPLLGKQISEIMVNTLVELHEIPYKGSALEKMSKPDGFLERQVHGWLKRYDKAKTDDIPEVELLKKWLLMHIPLSPRPTIIHYDYKLNNALFSEDLSKMIGLFDWEMTTIGDPLADVGAAMSYWIEKNDPEVLKMGFGKPPVTVYDGFYTRKEFIESYSKKSGRDVSNIHFYVTFAYFKLAVICQQIYARYKKGQTNDERFARFGSFVKMLIQHSLHMAHEKF
ncbi:aminoglycoside phosphotransferase (APT) family kinase protein [Oikeobacillus pervagus]|uniref:Aminoglycoside phosphotransferase (APT) family kinase protein n=1 Tax=Oikeobacillus pervagus TaxID=1325931 RepID=A0AAJ1SZF9_9BACI|nr:phosphotransferase family protein [Oikeobacillus pervagus]MDQ0215489.1 aminoglycoside phosphotransferase (APT) family kinase protein [Oikeobacillus pervagus]